MKKMKVVVCAPVINREMDACIKGGTPDGGRFLNNMVSGFRHAGIKVVNCVFIANQVMDKRIYGLISAEENKGDSFFQLKGKNIIRNVICYQKMALDQVNKGDIVIFYNMMYPYFGMADFTRKRKARPVLIYADHSDVKDVTGIINKTRAFIEEVQHKRFKHVVCLADFNPAHFRKNVKHITIRGGINFDYFKGITEPKLPSEDKPEIRIMFAGLLSNVTGIDIMLKAVGRVKQKNVAFYISGRGPLEEKVVKAAEKIENLHYLGFLDETDYFEQLGKVHIFLNPRNMELGENSNNFPSKIMEYLATGRIIISTKFSGYRDFQKEIIFCGNGADALAECIDDTVKNYEKNSKKYYNLNRKKAKKYDWDIQSKKILRFALEKG